MPGTFTSQTAGAYDIYNYRNFFWDDTNHQQYNSSNGGESMCCYVGPDHPGPADLGTLLNVVFEENYFPRGSNNHNRPRSIYSKYGCQMIRNRITHAYGNFGQRHGWGSKIWGNRIQGSSFIMIGDQRAGSYANGADVRNNVSAPRIAVYRASHLPSGSPYQACEWSTFFNNQANMDLGFKPGNAIADDVVEGGALDNVRIYQHAGAVNLISGNVNPATIAIDAANPLGLTNGAELIPATWDGSNTGFEVADQGL